MLFLSVPVNIDVNVKGNQSMSCSFEKRKAIGTKILLGMQIGHGGDMGERGRGREWGQHSNLKRGNKNSLYIQSCPGWTIWPTLCILLKFSIGHNFKYLNIVPLEFSPFPHPQYCSIHSSILSLAYYLNNSTAPIFTPGHSEAL